MSVHNPTLGKTAKDRGKSVGEIVNETTIMKEQVGMVKVVSFHCGLAVYLNIFLSFQLRHPNVVKYHKAFQESECTLYRYSTGFFFLYFLALQSRSAVNSVHLDVFK